MQYYAKVNTADPRIGFMSVGEMLTEEQARTLGKEKLDELTARGVLAACAASPKTTAPSPAPAGGTEETPDEIPDETPKETPDDTPEDDDELPELELGDDIVKDQPKEKPNKGGRKT